MTRRLDVLCKKTQPQLLTLANVRRPGLLCRHRRLLRNHSTVGARSYLNTASGKALPLVHARQPSRSLSGSSSPPKALINDTPNQEILIELDSGDAGRYPSFWLRDHCLCDICSHPSTHQRQHDTFALNQAIKASQVSSTPEGLRITWSDAQPHESTFPWEWLAHHSPFPTKTINPNTRHQATRPWTPFTSTTPKPQTPYPTLTSSDSTTGQQSLFANIHTYGLTFLPSTPPTPEATVSVLETLGPIRHTHYGGFWDFTSEVNPIDTAYTNLSLPLHTDNTYFTDPAGLQLFHLLSHVPTTTSTPQLGAFDPNLGGESTFSDGFAAADALFRTAPNLYQVLSTVPIVFAAEGSPAGSFRNNHTRPAGNPVLTHSTTPYSPTTLTQIRWNNLDRSPLTQFPSHAVMIEWLKAARLWDEILKSGEFEVQVQLVPGEPVVFDNWRVLHGRRAFEGRRRMCGGYIGMDDFRAGAGRVGVF